MTAPTESLQSIADHLASRNKVPGSFNEDETQLLALIVIALDLRAIREKGVAPAATPIRSGENRGQTGEVGS